MKFLAALLFLSFPAIATTIDTCTDYHCDVIVPVSLSKTELQQVRSLFRKVADTHHERDLISKAMGLMENIIGSKNGTSVDKGKNLPDFSGKGQLDCISESTNSTTYLRLLEQHGLLRWHSVNDRVVRHRWLFATHWTAVITDNTNGQQYAVDSWYRDNGQPAIVMPLDDWLIGAEG